MVNNEANIQNTKQELINKVVWSWRLNESKQKTYFNEID